MSYQKEVIDSVYDAVVVVGLTIGYALLGKKALRIAKTWSKNGP